MAKRILCALLALLAVLWVFSPGAQAGREVPGYAELHMNYPDGTDRVLTCGAAASSGEVFSSLLQLTWREGSGRICSPEPFFTWGSRTFFLSSVFSPEDGNQTWSCRNGCGAWRTKRRTPSGWAGMSFPSSFRTSVQWMNWCIW